MKKILIVDDCEADREILKRDLTRVGFEQIIMASTAEEGLSMVRSKNAPDLIILDIMMPKMFGSDLGRILKDDENTRHIPIIFVTGLQTHETVIKDGPESGNNLIFAKSLTPEKLINKVKEILGE